MADQQSRMREEFTASTFDASKVNRMLGGIVDGTFIREETKRIKIGREMRTEQSADGNKRSRLRGLFSLSSKFGEEGKQYRAAVREATDFGDRHVSIRERLESKLNNWREFAFGSATHDSKGNIRGETDRVRQGVERRADTTPISSMAPSLHEEEDRLPHVNDQNDFEAVVREAYANQEHALNGELSVGRDKDWDGRERDWRTTDFRGLERGDGDLVTEILAEREGRSKAVPSKNSALSRPTSPEDILSHVNDESFEATVQATYAQNGYRYESMTADAGRDTAANHQSVEDVAPRSSGVSAVSSAAGRESLVSNSSDSYHSAATHLSSETFETAKRSQRYGAIHIQGVQSSAGRPTSAVEASRSAAGAASASKGIDLGGDFGLTMKQAFAELDRARVGAEQRRPFAAGERRTLDAAVTKDHRWQVPPNAVEPGHIATERPSSSTNSSSLGTTVGTSILNSSAGSPNWPLPDQRFDNQGYAEQLAAISGRPEIPSRKGMFANRNVPNFSRPLPAVAANTLPDTSANLPRSSSLPRNGAANAAGIPDLTVNLDKPLPSLPRDISRSPAAEHQGKDTLVIAPKQRPRLDDRVRDGGHGMI